jgi:hypothetical protein
MELNQEQLLEVGFDSASSAVDGMPAHLSDRVANLGEGGSTVKAPQHPGWSEPGATRISALSAFVDTAAELGTLLDTLAGEDWRCGTSSSTSWAWSATSSASSADDRASLRIDGRTTGPRRGWRWRTWSTSRMVS